MTTPNTTPFREPRTRTEARKPIRRLNWDKRQSMIMRQDEKEYQRREKERLKQERLDDLVSEKGLLRILRSKPAKLHSSEALWDLKSDIFHLWTNCTTYKNYAGNRFYISEGRYARLELLLEDCQQRIEELREAEQQQEEARIRAAAAVKQYAIAGHDGALAINLQAAIDSVTHGTGYLYLRRWVMPDDSVWFKVGITNEPERRESEQNVLPVPMETIACVDVGSIERARALEAAIHQVLVEQRIYGANNCELFHLTDAQVATIKATIERLS